MHELSSTTLNQVTHTALPLGPTSSSCGRSERLCCTNGTTTPDHDCQASPCTLCALRDALLLRCRPCRRALLSEAKRTIGAPLWLWLRRSVGSQLTWLVRKHKLSLEQLGKSATAMHHIAEHFDGTASLELVLEAVIRALETNLAAKAEAYKDKDVAKYVFLLNNHAFVRQSVMSSDLKRFVHQRYGSAMPARTVS